MQRILGLLAIIFFILIPTNQSHTQEGNQPTAPAGLNSKVYKNKFEFARSHLLALAYLIENKQFYMNQTLLVFGTRPLQDKPHKATVLLGQKTTDQDWVLEEGSRAIWISGVPAPVPENPIVLAARFEEKNGLLMVQAVQTMKFSREKTASLKVDEYIFYPLPGSKSNICPIELSGAAVEIDYYDEFECVILHAVKPGKAVLKVFTQWWHSSQAEFLAEYEIMVDE